MKSVRSTLVLIQDGIGNILLGQKKRGFGKGKWNGFGGKIEANETIKQAAVREVKEECSLSIHEVDIQYIGLLHFTMNHLQLLLEVHVLLADKYQGKVEESEEMFPKWYNVNNLPFNEMWKDDPYWFPFALQRKTFYGTFTFDDDSTMVSDDVQEKSIDQIRNYFIKPK